MKHLLLFLLPVALFAQGKPATVSNLVPNPGFERFVGAPIGWSYRGAYFGQVVKYWFSATTASPDVYGPGVTVPADWREKGFGNERAHWGKAMAGLTLYGCTNGKPHCREYIEIQLAEPLVIGQTYLVEFWVQPLERSLRINNIGAWFSESRIEHKTDFFINEKAHVKAAQIVDAKSYTWTKISGLFKADKEYEYLLLGNFDKDEDTRAKRPAVSEPHNYGYYYIDDVLVKKAPPYLTVPVKPDDLTRQTFVPGKVFTLKNIYFEFDKDELMPRSFVELNKLLQVLRSQPGLSIEVVGHTDNIGDDQYNLELSRRRAAAVVNFLIENKIARNRLRSNGHGESKPVADNNSDAGRAQNRRVEFVVLSAGKR